MQRIIREVEPPRPSMRLSASAETLAAVAARRRVEPAKLGQMISGELDWIVMRAMEKDRTRRYETANALGADVRRHLAGDAVAAAPPSRAYLLRKFVRRHRGAVTAAGLVAVALVLGVLGTTLSLWKANWQRTLADNRLSQANAAKLAEAAQRRRAEENERAAVKGRKEAERETRLARALNYVQECTFREYAQAGTVASRFSPAAALEKAATDAARQFADQPELLSAIYQVVGERYYGWGWLKEAERYFESARRLRHADHDTDDADPEALTSAHFLALVREGQGRNGEAEYLFKRVVAARRSVLGESDPETLLSMMRLGDLLAQTGRPAEAEPLLLATLETRATLYRQALMWQGVRASDWIRPVAGSPTLRERAISLCESEYRLADQSGLPGDAPGRARLVGAAYLLAAMNHVKKDDRSAEELLRKVLEWSPDAKGEPNPIRLAVVEDLCDILEATGRSHEARGVYDDFVKRRVATLGEGDPATLYARHCALRRRESGDAPGDALQERQLLVDDMRQTLGETHLYTLESMKALSLALRRAGRREAAFTTIEEALRLARQSFKDQSSIVAELWAAKSTMSDVLVVKVVGVAQFRESPDQPWERLMVGRKLSNTVLLRTGLKSGVELQLLDGSVVFLGALRTVSIVSAVDTKRQSPPFGPGLDPAGYHRYYDIANVGFGQESVIRTSNSTLAIRG
jgi:tetratricopeptide (TPR) repeat protein